MSVQPHDATTVIGPRRRMGGGLADVWRYRELLTGLVRKELKVKYKDSALGFLWSMLNPVLYLVVFYVVFDLFLGGGIPNFEIFLLSGLLAWNLFSTALASATGAVVQNSSLVNKVYFPRTILPLASVGASLVHFFIQALVLVLTLALFRYTVAWSYMPLIIPALIVLLLFIAALALLLSAFNVYARDTQHLLELALLAWFWMTPIVYPYRLVADKLVAGSGPSWLFLVNPVTPVVLTLQRAIYGQVGGEAEGGLRALGGTADSGTPAILPADATQLWYLRNLAIVGIVAVVLLIIALAVFRRLEGNFAEEL